MMPVVGLRGGTYDHLLVGLYDVPEKRIAGIVSLVYRAQLADQLSEAQAHRLHEVAHAGKTCLPLAGVAKSIGGRLLFRHLPRENSV